MEKPFLHLSAITKTYDDGFTAVNNFDLKIKKGEFVTLLGPSGCGKTTMLKMLAGFEQPSSGKILYNGVDIKDMPIRLRPTSTVFQDYALFPNMTVKQNILYGLKLMRTPKDNIDPSIYTQAEKVFLNSEKKANEKIKGISKKREQLLAEIKKVEAKYNKSPELLEIKDMRRTQFIATLEELWEQQENESDQSKINAIELQIKQLKKLYKDKSAIDKKYDALIYKYNDLDYWESYWSIYPEIKKEQFEKHNITRRLTKQEANERAEKVIELIGLKHKANSHITELSGGMQQRVALARSIVIEPEIILLDEPLSALDAKVRKQLQDEIKSLHTKLGLTFILVTHDQEEALSLSDKVVVMSHGQIEQVGTPSDIYDSPNSLWVANFIGKTNIFEGVYKDKGSVEFDGVVSETDVVEGFEKGEKCLIMIRPEDFDVLKAGEGSINAVVESVLYKGLLWDIKCRYKDMIINVEGIDEVKVNETIGLDWDDIDVHVIKWNDEYDQYRNNKVADNEN